MCKPLSEEKKQRLVGGFKLQLNGVFSPFNMYGLGSDIPGAIEMVTELALLLHKNLNGDNIPIAYELAKMKVEERRARDRKK